MRRSIACPPPSVLTGWAEQAPNGFRYVLKAPQRITHFQRLKGSEESITFLANSLASLGDHRGPILFGLPPNFKKDVPRLRDFLRILEINTIGPIAFEFRNQSWFDDETFDLLRGYKAGAALCIAEAEGDLKVPFVSTAPWGYVRLRLPEYSTADLKAWLKDIRKQDWTEAYVFFKHEDGGLGPKFARQLLDVAEK